MMGAVLAGGESRRMGRSKALLPWGGGVLAQRQAQVLSSLCARTVGVASAQNAAELQPLFPELVMDRYADSGPLAGLHAALAHAVETGFTRVMVLAVDLPGVNAEFLDHLDAQYVGQTALLPVWEGREQPLCGIYSIAVLPRVEEALGAGQTGVIRFLSAQQGVEWMQVREDMPGWHPLLLHNVNTWEDVEGFANLRP